MEQEVGYAVGGLMGLLIAALVGLVVGAAAKLLMPGADPGGWVATILLGIAGSWVGGWLIGILGMAGTVPYLLGAVAGAMLLLFGYRVITKKA